MAAKKKANPVTKFAEILNFHRFHKTAPSRVLSNTYIFERDFRDRATKEEFYFDFAVYGRKRNFYVELNDPSHEKPWRKKRDGLKVASARRAGVPVLTLTYEEMDGMSDADIWKSICTYLK